MIVLVEITADDITCGCHEAYNCPAHLAITRLLKPQYQALVCHSLIAIQRRVIPMSPAELRQLPLEQQDEAAEYLPITPPRALREFLSKYDAVVPTAGPTSFELDIPEKYLQEGV